ncbi:MAG TPA: hypothetical protein V6D30_18735 [Leptolyngbyaceae cyanobacterium]
MGQVAHGNVLPLKPHAVSANYINKMINYCGSDVYKQLGVHWRKSLSLLISFTGIFLVVTQPTQVSKPKGLILTNFIRISSEELQKIHQGAMGWYAKIDSTV